MSSASKAILIAASTEVYDLLAPHYAQWAIFSSGTSDEAITPDSFCELEFRGESRVCNYPLERGAFASYNKVQMPFGLRVQLVCDGNLMGTDDFLRQLAYMLNSTETYDLSTPHGFYEGVTVTRFDYKKTAKAGASMIVADVMFEEIREVASATYTANGSAPTITGARSPSAESQRNAGTATTAAPTPAELLALQRGIQ